METNADNQSHISPPQTIQPSELDHTLASRPFPVLPVILTLLFSGILFGIGGYFLGKQTSSQIINEITPSPTQPLPSPSPTSQNTENSISDWQTYTDYAFRFTIQYPQEWRLVEFLNDNPKSSGEYKSIGFGPNQVQEDTLWGLSVYEKSIRPVEKTLSEYGNQFPDKKQTKEDIFINNLPATKYTTTTVTYPDWRADIIIVDLPNPNYYLVISATPLDAAMLKTRNVNTEGVSAEKFYNSLRLLNN